MNPLQRRHQLFLALACEQQNISTKKKINHRKRLEAVERLLAIAKHQLERVESGREVLEKRVQSLEEKVKKKKEKVLV